MRMWYWTAGMGIWWNDNLFSLDLSFFDKFCFSGRWLVGLFLWQPSFLFLLNNDSGKNDFKSNTTLLIKVWCTLMKWYLIEYLIKTKLFPKQIAFSIGLRATSDKMTVPTSLEMEMHSPWFLRQLQRKWHFPYYFAWKPFYIHPQQTCMQDFYSYLRISSLAAFKRKKILSG